MRIAVIHTGWPLQSLLRDLANGLAGAGHDLLVLATTEDDRAFVDLHSFRVRVELVPTLGLLDKLDRRIRRRLGTLVPAGIPGTPPWVCGNVERALARWGRPDLLLGVEKAGLDLANALAASVGAPVVYYSLELYLEDHPARASFAWQRARERACHARARGTIIQDASRWQALRSANGVGEQPVFFLPVGAGDAAAPASRPPRADGACTLLSLGVQGRGRFTHELVAVAPHLPSRVHLHLHGPVYDPDTRRLAAGPLPPNLRFTTRLVPERELPALLATADIGLALYRCDYANDRLTAYSSQKVALYLQAGLPIVSLSNEAYADLFARFRCGEMIDGIAELGAATRRILDDYPAYAAAARAAFGDIYRLDRYWGELSRFLAACADRSRLA